MQGTTQDIIVVSDLHIGRGKNVESGRHHALEAFFYDDDFARFCAYLCNDARARNSCFTLVLNGDVFDFLRIEPEEQTDGSLTDRLYGAPMTPQMAARTLRQILAAHKGFVHALAQVLAAGHSIVMLPGNHDIETQWRPVRSEMLHALRESLSHHWPTLADASIARFRTEDWFYYEPGRIWIEHGCQYDPENAFRFQLRSGLADLPEHVAAAEHDMPLGNFFQRYLYNAFGHITFIVPTARANVRYIKWLLVNQPRFLARVLVSHLPFALQMIRRLAKASDTKRHDMERAHSATLQDLAQSSGLEQKLYEVDSLKEVQTDVVGAARSIGWQLVKATGAILSVALLTSGLYFVGFLAINELRAGFGLKSLLFLALNFLMLLLAGGSIGYSLFRGASPQQAPFERAAQRLTDLLAVPLVVFGHTHDEVVARLRDSGERRSWYFNTGTWIAVFTHDVLLPRERVQYTYLHVRGYEGELLHFSPGRNAPLPVIILDEEKVAPPGVQRSVAK